MTLTLNNGAIHLAIDPQRNLFSVTPRQENVPQIEHAHFSVRYRRGLNWQLQEDILPSAASDQETRASVHGALRTRTVRYGPNRDGLLIELTFALAQTQPFLLWKMRVANASRQTIALGRIEMLRVGFTAASQADFRRSAGNYPRGVYKYRMKSAEPAFFSNGWGSWNHTGAFGFAEKFRRTRFRWFNGPMRINPGTPQPRATGHFSSDMFAVIADRRHRGGLLIGFLSQKKHFGTVEVLTSPITPALSLWANGDETLLSPEDSMETDWACLAPLHLDSPDPLGPYLEAVMREHGLESADARPVPVGWCSWYQYFQKISSGVIEENLAGAQAIRKQVPLDLVQIDDGWQAQIGDWSRFSPGFEGGPAPLAQEIRSAGFTPGLWLAPFILHPQANLARERPEWVLRNRAGLPVNAGFVWNTFTRALDLSLPEALDHAVETVRRAAVDWGYPYLKLDFLYAGALQGRRADRTRTRAEILRGAFERIRSGVGGETVLLGCGSPLGPAVGLFDAMRINADVAPQWFPRFLSHERLFRREPDFPAARNAIQNALTRAPLHGRLWINDPDCLLLRPDSDLTLPEVRSLATVIALTGGSLLLSDDLNRLPVERLKIARQLLPVIGKRPLVVDWFDEAMPGKVRLDLQGPAGTWHLLARFNWREKQGDLDLSLVDFLLDPEKDYIARSFWTGEVFRIKEGSLKLPGVAPHGCVLLAVRETREAAQYIGSDLHISQGLELAAWETAPGIVRFELEGNGETEGTVLFRVPGTPEHAGLSRLDVGLYEMQVRFVDRMQGGIRYS